MKKFLFLIAVIVATIVGTPAEAKRRMSTAELVAHVQMEEAASQDAAIQYEIERFKERCEKFGGTFLISEVQEEVEVTSDLKIHAREDRGAVYRDRNRITFDLNHVIFGPREPKIDRRVKREQEFKIPRKACARK